MDWLAIGWTGHSGNDKDEPIFASSLVELDEQPFVKGLVHQAANDLFKGQKHEFSHPINLEFNPAFQLVNKLKDSAIDNLEYANSLIALLSSKIIHPRVKASNILIGKTSISDTEVLFILKIEAFDRYVSFSKNSIIKEDEGLNFKSKFILGAIKLDEPSYAYVSSNEDDKLKYWNEDFLGLIPVSDSFSLTKQVLNAVSSFSKERLDDFDGDVFEAAKFRTKALAYIKEHQSFDIADFEEKVFQQDDSLSTLFSVHMNDHGIYESITSEPFEVSKAAIKKVQGQFSKSIRLDDSVVISIKSAHVKMERGFDNKSGLKTLTLYFKEEK